MKTVSILIILVVIIAGVVWFTTSQAPEEGALTSPTGNETLQDETSTTSPETAETSPGSYEPYSENKLARAEDGDVVLFFKASWCPTCNALEKDIQENVREIPSDLSILTLDYDTETERKQKYGVTIQHTLVQVDSQGNAITSWNGGTTLDSVVARVQ